MSARRFPPPWSVEELEACFVMRDHDGQQLAYVLLRFENKFVVCIVDRPRLEAFEKRLAKQ